MKAFKYLFILLLAIYYLQSQAQYYGLSKYSRGNVTLGIGPVLLLNTEARFPLAGSYSMQYFLGSRFCVKSDLVIGDNYAHFGLGILGMSCWLAFNSASSVDISEYRNWFTEAICLIIFVPLSFEHISFHIPVSKYSDISPSLSLLRFTIQRYGDSHTGAAVGCRYNLYHNRFIFSPYGEYSMFYDDMQFNFNIGFLASYLIKPKRGRII